MTYQDKIIKFMQEKEKIIKTYNKDLEYINQNIVNNIKSWSNEDSEIVWGELICNIEIENECGLYTPTCPYCIYRNDACFNCYYGEIYGRCCYFSSNYMKIREYNIDISNRKYRKIIKNIVSKV